MWRGPDMKKTGNKVAWRLVSTLESEGRLRIINICE